MKRLSTIAAVMLTCLLGTAAYAQQNSPGAAAKPDVLVKIDLVLSRFQGDKKTSSLPISTLVTVRNGVNGSSTTQTGVDLPIGATTTTTSQPTSSGSAQTTIRSTTANQYRNVGTSVNYNVSPSDDGKFLVRFQVDDSSVYTSADSKTVASRDGVALRADQIAFRTLQLRQEVPLRDGQTLEFASSTDKLTGEVVKASATLTVVK